MTTCRDCGKRWSGQGRMHCAKCHQTLEDEAEFVQHRKAKTRGKCILTSGEAFLEWLDDMSWEDGE